MDIFLDSDAGVGLAVQIYEQIRAGIVAGRFNAGDRLPPTRELATTLGVSRHTVTTAYGRLSAEGYLNGNQGGGTVVAATVETDFRRAEMSLQTPQAVVSEPQRYPYDLRVGTPDARLFPLTEWKRRARWAVDGLAPGYGDPAGSVDLRKVLARWIGLSRGVETTFRQVVVTSGAQQALYLVSRVVAGTGGVVAVEDPGYPRFRAILEAIGASVVPVPVDDEGIVVSGIPPAAQIVYVTPSHQFPTGVTMSIGRRRELLALAVERDMVIIEDDYDSEFRYVDRPLEPLFRLDRSDRVVYVASFSKTLSPALRLGFAVVPPWLWSPVVELRKLIDWAPSEVDQMTLRSFVGDGHLDRHLRRIRRVYEGRHQRLTSLLEGVAQRGLIFPSVSNAGLHVSARLAEGMDEAGVVEELAKRGVAIEGLQAYSMTERCPAGLVFGFGCVDSDAIDAASPIINDVLRRPFGLM